MYGLLNRSWPPITFYSLNMNVTSETKTCFLQLFIRYDLLLCLGYQRTTTAPHHIWIVRALSCFQYGFAKNIPSLAISCLSIFIHALCRLDFKITMKAQGQTLAEHVIFFSFLWSKSIMTLHYFIRLYLLTLFFDSLTRDYQDAEKSLA